LYSNLLLEKPNAPPGLHCDNMNAQRKLNQTVLNRILIPVAIACYTQRWQDEEPKDEGRHYWDQQAAVKYKYRMAGRGGICPRHGKMREEVGGSR
jgi:hypothetical protein